MVKKRILIPVLLFLFAQSYAQTPDMYPPPVPQPVEFTGLNVVLYIVLPLLLIVSFILYRRWIKKKRKKNNE